MHPNPSFRGEMKERNIEFVRSRSFGSLCINGPDGPLIAHIPFCLSQDENFIELHFVRSNSMIPLLQQPQKAVIAITEPKAYISPDWYGIENQVPTWNYVAVHLRGVLKLLDPERLHDQ